MVPQFHSQLILIEYDTERWFLNEPLIYTTLILGFPWKLEVPSKRFPTDLASIPHILRPILRRGGTHKAAVVHDWLCYRNPRHHNRGRDGIDRGQADRIFKEALLVCGVNPIKAQIMYLGVRAYSLTRR